MLLVTVDPPLAQQASLRPTTASRPWSSPKKHKNRFCYRGISTFSHKPTTSTPTNSSPSPTVSPLHLPAGRRRVMRAHPKHSPFRGGGGMVWQYAKHSLPLLPPEEDRVCHPTNRYPASPRIKIASANRPKSRTQSIPGFPPDKTASATGHGYGSEGVKGRRWQQEDIRFARSFWTIFCF